MRSDYEHLDHYVLGVASIAERVSGNGEAHAYDVDEPLPAELPNDITPEDAEHLASWLEPALDRAGEVLGLLVRRSHEDPVEFQD